MTAHDVLGVFTNYPTWLSCQTDLTAKTRLSDRATAHIKAVFINIWTTE